MVSAVMFMGASYKNLGDIVVNSIMIESEFGSTHIVGAGIATYNADGKMVNFITVGDDGGGQLRTYNADGIETVLLGTGKYGGIATSNTDGKRTAFLGTDLEGFGFLETNNKHGVRVGYFGSGKSNDGMALLYDRYGDTGWGESGKK